MDRNNNKHSLKREKACMIAASVFMLSALTLTGVYMASFTKGDEEDNTIDFAQIAQESEQLADTRYTNGEETSQDSALNNDMDVDPTYTEVNSGTAVNSTEEARDLIDAGRNEMSDARFGEDIAKEEPVVVTEEESVTQELVTPEAQLSFGEGDTLQWPIVGEVLLDYSMDQAVYFATMQQYRYNPSLVIAATEGETITAAADAVVEEIYYDEQTGNTILFDLGDGYELTYGQLTDITLAEGDTVQAGDIVGKVAAPSIYYSVEGANVYFKLTHDGEPVDPMSVME